MNTILLVDDQPDFLDNLCLALEFAGYHTLTATDGLDALSVLQQHPVDLIVSDIGMPQLSGYQLCQQVRQHVGWANIPFVVLTGSDSAVDADRRAVQQLRIESFLTKPIRAADLLQVIENTLAN
jgi:two-component system OmpR family response regulator